MTDIAGFSGVQMEPGTLYGALSRLESAAGSGRSPAGNAVARTRSPPPGKAGQVKAMRQIVRVVPGGLCVAAVVDTCLPVKILSKT